MNIDCRRGGLRRKLLPLLVLLLLTVLLTACGGTKAEETGAEKSDATEQTVEDFTAAEKSDAGEQTLEDFTADTLDGGEFTMEDVKASDLTMINVWGTYCPPCLEEMPELARLETSLPDNVKLVTYCIDGAEERQAAEEIIEETGFEGVVMISQDGGLDDLLDQSEYVPTTYFIDRSGKMAADPVVGAPEDPANAYLDTINECLQKMGTDPV